MSGYRDKTKQAMAEMNKEFRDILGARLIAMCLMAEAYSLFTVPNAANDKPTYLTLPHGSREPQRPQSSYAAFHLIVCVSRPMLILTN